MHDSGYDHGMIERDMRPTLLHLADQYPVVLVTGPRQSGKTTLGSQLYYFPTAAMARQIKSGATINRDYFKGLDYLSKLGIPSLTSGAVIYAGSNPQTRGLWQACPPQQMEPLLQSL